MTPLKHEVRPVTTIHGTASQDRALTPLPWWQRHRRLLVGAGIALVALIALAIPALRALSNGERSVPSAQLRIAAVNRGRSVSDVAAEGVVIAALSPTLVAPAQGSAHFAVRAGEVVSARAFAPNAARWCSASCCSTRSSRPRRSRSC